MFTKRTNILFDEKLWRDITILAKQMDTSVGKLVRRAVRKTYFPKEKNKQIAKACDDILSLRKRYKKVNYKDLINYGRKI